MKIHVYLFLALFTGIIAYGQGENDNWYFGRNAGLNFSTNPPSALFDGQLNDEEPAASVSDPQGKLLFYTDGTTVWNRAHQTMLNGTGLLSTGTTQQIAIVPFPGNSNLYYIFTTGAYDGAINNFSYSIVDMTLGAIGTDGLPLGGVTDKNTDIHNESGQDFPFVSEHVTMVAHSDNKSYWVLFKNGINLYSYRITSAGFNPVPVVSTIPGTPAPNTTFSHLRISPELPDTLGLNYSHLIAVTAWYISATFDVRVFSFDNSTGLITNHYFLRDPGALGPGYSEFSQDGTLLYTSGYTNQNTFVYNLFASDLSNIANIRRLLYTNPGPQTEGAALQRSKYGDIYLSLNTGTTLARILNPDSFANASVELNSFALGRTPTRGFPQMVPILSTSAGGACWENLTLGFPETTNITRQVSSTITTNNFYKVSSGLNVSLKAGDFILMLPNTFIQAGSQFVAEIDGCTPSASRPSNKAQSPVRIILNEKAETKAIIYPNPASDIAKISLTGDVAIKNLTVYTKEGRILFDSEVNNNNYDLNVSEFEKGIYLVTLTTENGEVLTSKIIKE